MRAELTLSASTLIAFALVLSRMLGVFVFVPLPGKGAGPNAARILFAFAAALALFPRWPAIDAQNLTLATTLPWLVLEAVLGTAIGLMVGFLAEWLTFGVQVLAMQAGYGYASFVDPTTNADSEVLGVVAQLFGGLLFFATGMHRYLIRAFAQSLDAYPPGQFTLRDNLGSMVIQLGANIFSLGLRLALPIVGLMWMTDLALALLGRINAQLHLGFQAFPAKMLLTLAMLVSLLVVVPALYQSFAAQTFEAIQRTLAR